MAHVSVRMLCPATGNKTHTVNGRVYTGVVGTPQDVLDVDAMELQANGWMTSAMSGAFTTATRPTLLAQQAGYVVLDTTLGYDVVWDGAAWRNPSTGASV